MLLKWPAGLKSCQKPIHESEQPIQKQSSQKHRLEVATRTRLWSALLEGYRREHEPFDEYLEMLLHFLWTSCFAIVWPVGCVWALINQLLEYRFDCAKLLVVRRRRFPNTRHMSVAWVPFFTNIVCQVAIVVNVALLLLPYRILSGDLPEDMPLLDESIRSFSLKQHGPRVLVAFVGLWLALVLFRRFAVVVCKRLTWADGAPKLLQHLASIGTMEAAPCQRQPANDLDIV